MIKNLSLILISAALLIGQSRAPNTTITQEPAVNPTTVRMFLNGSSQIEYVCRAPAWSTTSSWTVASNTLTSVVSSAGVATVTFPAAHGLYAGASIVISGSSTAAVNGTFKVSATPTAFTLTLLTSSIPDGTYNNAALTVTTTAPRTNQGVWVINKLEYSGTALVNFLSSGGGYNKICDNRASTDPSTAIAYQ